MLATFASACCVGPAIAPIVVAVLGASGAAWAAGLKPYSPFLLGGSLLLLLYSFWTIYRPRVACADGSCPLGPPRAGRIVLWIAAFVWLAAAVPLLCNTWDKPMTYRLCEEEPR